MSSEPGGDGTSPDAQGHAETELAILDRSGGATPDAASMAAYLSRWLQGVRAGDLGSLPIIVGLVVIVIVFGSLDDTFFVERNFTNLLLQMAPVATIAIGIVFVLLIGEIDLSVGFVSAVGGVVMTLLLRPG